MLKLASKVKHRKYCKASERLIKYHTGSKNHVNLTQVNYCFADVITLENNINL